MERKRYRKLNLSHKSHFLHCFSLFFFSVCTVLFIIVSTVSTHQQDNRSPLSGQAADAICFQGRNAPNKLPPLVRDRCILNLRKPPTIFHDKGIIQGNWSISDSPEIAAKRKIEESMGSIPVDNERLPLNLARRFLSGPGSSPPRCTSKCGKCKPCKPVHVPVPPGTPVTAEYYPEAWRCKCGNKLYMP